MPNITLREMQEWVSAVTPYSPRYAEEGALNLIGVLSVSGIRSSDEFVQEWPGIRSKMQGLTKGELKVLDYGHTQLL